MTMKLVTDATFQSDVVEAGGPVLVNFWAEWCGPCQRITTALEALADELGDRVTFVKLDIDESPRAQLDYEVMSLPMLMVFKGGVVAARRSGIMLGPQLKDFIEQVVQAEV